MSGWTLRNQGELLLVWVILKSFGVLIITIHCHLTHNTSSPYCVCTYWRTKSSSLNIFDVKQSKRTLKTRFKFSILQVAVCPIIVLQYALWVQLKTLFFFCRTESRMDRRTNCSNDHKTFFRFTKKSDRRS